VDACDGRGTVARAMNQPKRTFGRRVGGPSAEDLLIYRETLNAEARTKQKRRGASPPISNEIQGLRGLASFEGAQQSERSASPLSSVLLAVLLFLVPVGATLGPAISKCGGFARSIDAFSDDTVKTCVRQRVMERLHSVEAYVIALGR
jgi:hypothetical protein